MWGRTHIASAGVKTPEAENLSVFGCQRKQQIRPILHVLQISESNSKRDLPPSWKKRSGFASISRTISRKSGVNVSSPVHAVATPLMLPQNRRFLCCC